MCKFLVSYKKYMYYVQFKLWFIPAIFLKSIKFLILRYNQGAFHSQKSRTPLAKNLFFCKKNPSKIGINPFVGKKSRTLFPMSELPLGYNVKNNAQDHILRTLTKRTLNIISF